MAAEMQKLVERLEKVVGRLELAASQSSGAGDVSSAGSAAYVQAFDVLLDGSVAQYMKISKEIGGDVSIQADMVLAGFKIQRGVLVTASNCQQPGENELLAVLRPLSNQIQAAQEFREKNRGSKLFNHLSAISESVPALGWVAVTPKPGPYVKEMHDAAMFYTNRVLKEYKDVNKKHVDWAKTYLNIWVELQAYIKEYHTTGLAWSKTGPKASGAACPAAPRAGAPVPPPPPPGPPPPAPGPTSADSGASTTRSELFAQINQGEGITQALKHVPDNMKTHKNPGLKSQGGPIRSGPKPFITPKPTAACGAHPKTAPKKDPPMLELDGKKWRVENHDNASKLVIDETALKQVVYVYKCVNSTLQVKGKINSITVDNCKKLGLVFDDAVGIVEIINCRDVKVQVMGKVPTVSINKTDGCHVYLSKDCLDCEIVSAKSSEMNILIPTSNGDFNEFPVPEQFKTVWNGQKLVTTMTEIAG